MLFAPYELKFRPRKGVSARQIIGLDIAPQLLKVQRITGIFDGYIQGLAGVALLAILRAMNQDSHPCTAVQGVDLEEVEGTKTIAKLKPKPRKKEPSAVESSS